MEYEIVTRMDGWMEGGSEWRARTWMKQEGGGRGCVLEYLGWEHGSTAPLKHHFLQILSYHFQPHNKHKYMLTLSHGLCSVWLHLPGERRFHSAPVMDVWRGVKRMMRSGHDDIAYQMKSFIGLFTSSITLTWCGRMVGWKREDAEVKGAFIIAYANV